MGGVPCIRGMRIPVATVLGLIADGLSTAEVLRELPYLEPEDVKAALRHSDLDFASRESSPPDQVSVQSL
jgi:uncharacterized protein (DUF433 family)